VEAAKPTRSSAVGRRWHPPHSTSGGEHRILVSRGHDLGDARFARRTGGGDCHPNGFRLNARSSRDDGLRRKILTRSQPRPGCRLSRQWRPAGFRSRPAPPSSRRPLARWQFRWHFSLERGWNVGEAPENPVTRHHRHLDFHPGARWRL